MITDALTKILLKLNYVRTFPVYIVYRKVVGGVPARIIKMQEADD